MSVITINAINDNATGYINDQQSSFSTVRNDVNGLSAFPASNLMVIQTQISGGTYFIKRVFSTFSLTIPSGSFIISAKIQGYASGIFNDDSTTLEVVQTTQSSSLVVGDYSKLTFNSLGSQSISGITNGQYNDIVLNATGIALIQSNIGGTLKLGIITGLDLSSTAPGGTNNSNQVQIAGASDGSNPIRIQITYSPPGAFLTNFV